MATAKQPGNGAKFNAGDTVALISGGPVMTVKSASAGVGGKQVVCQWFAGKKLEQGVFEPESLKAVKPDAKP